MHTAQQPTTRKMFEWANLAIENNDKRMAEGVCLRLNRKYGLNQPGINEYLAAHGVDMDRWEELVRSI